MTEKRTNRPTILPVIAAILCIGAAVWGTTRYYQQEQAALAAEVERSYNSALLRSVLLQSVAEVAHLGSLWTLNNGGADADPETIAGPEPGLVGLILLSGGPGADPTVLAGPEDPANDLVAARPALEAAWKAEAPKLTGTYSDNANGTRFSVAVPVGGGRTAQKAGLVLAVFDAVAFVGSVARNGPPLDVPTVLDIFGGTLALPPANQAKTLHRNDDAFLPVIAGIGTVVFLGLLAVHLNHETESRLSAERIRRYNAQLKEYADRLEAENLERRMAEAEVNRAREATGRFLSTMNREIRTSLNTVIGLFRLIANTDTVPDGQKKQAANGIETAERLLSQLTNVLDASRLDAGAMELEPRETELSPMIEAWSAYLERASKASGKPIEARVKTGDYLPGQVHLDPARVGQIVSNLLDNAVKFTERGEVALQVGFVPGSANVLVVKVSDSGPGIAEDKREMLFERFYHGQRADTSDRDSPGLGLTISRDLAGLMGGSLSFEPGPDGGTVFNLRLYNVVGGAQAAA